MSYENPYYYVPDSEVITEDLAWLRESVKVAAPNYYDLAWLIECAEDSIAHVNTRLAHPAVQDPDGLRDVRERLTLFATFWNEQLA